MIEWMRSLNTRGTFFKAWYIFQLSQNLLIGNMILVWFWTSISLLDSCIEYNHNTKIFLIIFLICQFLRAHQMKNFQILCIMTTTLILFEDTNNQHTHICQWSIRHQHPTTWKLGTSCSSKTWYEKWHRYVRISVFYS